mgnify:CR=1 FL=1
MQISCNLCRKVIAFPSYVKVVQCPNCNDIFKVEDLPNQQSTGWRLASLGLLLSFNFYILGPIFLSIGGGTFNTAGFMIFLSIIGSPLAFTGLLMSIVNKIKSGNKRILLELVFLIAVSANIYVILTMGSIG